MTRNPDRRSAGGAVARVARAAFATAFAAALAAACGREFTTDPAARATIAAAARWPDTLTVQQDTVLEVRLTNDRLGALAAPRLRWTSSDERVLRVDAIPTAGLTGADSAAAANRTRVRVSGVGPGRATLDVALEGAGGPVDATPASVALTVATPRVGLRAGRDTLTVTDVDTVDVRALTAQGDTLPGARLVWRSSDEAVLRIVPLAGRTGDAEADSLAARALRVRVEARGPGVATLSVGLEARAGSAAPTVATLARVVAPLRIVADRWPVALSAGASDTLRVELRDVRGQLRAEPTLTWRSSDETRLRLVPIPATGAGDDSLAVRRYRMQVLALADGAAAVTVGLDASVAGAGADTTVAVQVAPLAVVRSRGRDTLSVTDVDTLQVRLATGLADSIGRARFDWTTSDAGVLMLAQPALTGDPAADTLAVRQARMRATARAPGTVVVTARSRPAAGEPAVERSWRLTVLPLALERVFERVPWRDTVSVADVTDYAVRVVNARGEPVRGATVAWRTSADSVLHLAGDAAAVPGAPGVWRAAAEARVHGSAVLTAVATAFGGEAVAAPLEVPVRVMERYVQVVVQSERSCALSVRGRAYCWGNRVGAGIEGSYDPVPTLMVSPLTQQALRLSRLLAGENHVCGASAAGDGTWYCWGRNEASQLTDGSPLTDRTSPAPMLLGGLRPRAMSVTTSTSCMTADRSRTIAGSEALLVYCWGASGSPTLAARSGGAAVRFPSALQAVPHSPPRDVCTSRPRVVECLGFYAVAAGAQRACALHRGAAYNISVDSVVDPGEFDFEHLYCWGANADGALGASLTNPAPSAVAVVRVPAPRGARSVLSDVVLAGGTTACYRQAGDVRCWSSVAAAPRRIAALAGVAAGTLSAAPHTSVVCGVRVVGDAGVCVDVTPNGLPFDLGPGSPHRVSSVSVSPGGWPDRFHGCAVRADDGAVLCWGNNQQGQVGNGQRRQFASREGVQRILEPVR